MPVVDPAEYGSPVTDIDAIIRAYVAQVSKTLGEPSWPMECVRHRSLYWSALWFTGDDQVENLRVNLAFGMIKAEIRSRLDPTSVLFFVRSPEKLEETLQRFMPDHWKESG